MIFLICQRSTLCIHRKNSHLLYPRCDCSFDFFHPATVVIPIHGLAQADIGKDPGHPDVTGWRCYQLTVIQNQESNLGHSRLVKEFQLLQIQGSIDRSKEWEMSSCTI